MRQLLFGTLLMFVGPLYAQDSARIDTIKTVALSSDSANVAAMRNYFSAYGLNPDSATTRKLYELVYEWKGTRYQYAGHSKKGVDCSGFANELYTQCYDTTLPGGCANIYTMVDTVHRDSLREGDLLFFKIRKGQISHVGVYLGNRHFAHASVHSGVTVSSLDEAYYRKYYFTAGRLKKKN